MYRKIIALLMLVSLGASAHEMTPTYPKLEVSYIEDVYKTTIQMFNKRQDVSYYEIGVFDSNFKPVPFVSSYTVFKLEYLSHITLDVYIRKEDLNKAVYVCSRSKLRKEDAVRTAVSSRICSKFK